MILVPLEPCVCVYILIYENTTSFLVMGSVYCYHVCLLWFCTGYSGTVLPSAQRWGLVKVICAVLTTEAPAN